MYQSKDLTQPQDRTQFTIISLLLLAKSLSLDTIQTHHDDENFIYLKLSLATGQTKIAVMDCVTTSDLMFEMEK